MRKLIFAIKYPLITRFLAMEVVIEAVSSIKLSEIDRHIFHVSFNIWLLHHIIVNHSKGATLMNQEFVNEVNMNYDHFFFVEQIFGLSFLFSLSLLVLYVIINDKLLSTFKSKEIS